MELVERLVVFPELMERPLELPVLMALLVSNLPLVFLLVLMESMALELERLPSVLQEL